MAIVLTSVATLRRAVEALERLPAGGEPDARAPADAPWAASMPIDDAEVIRRPAASVRRSLQDS